MLQFYCKYSLRVCIKVSIHTHTIDYFSMCTLLIAFLCASMYNGTASTPALKNSYKTSGLQCIGGSGGVAGINAGSAWTGF